MKIGLSVSKFITCNVRNNLEVIEQSIINAKQKGVDFLCFGEAVLQGFHSLNGNYGRDIEIAIPLDSQEFGILKNMALNYSIALGVGYLEKSNKDIFSSYVIIDNNGEVVYNYQRISQGWKDPNWNAFYKEGESAEPFEILGHKFKVGLCGDLWSNEKVLSELKSQKIIWPVYIDYGYKEWADGTALIEYAQQAQLVGEDVFLVNSVLHDYHFKAEGRACHFKNGQIVAQLELSEEGILISDI